MLIAVGSQSATAQSIKENIKKQAADSTNKDRAAKADVYLMDKQAMQVMDTTVFKSNSAPGPGSMTTKTNKAIASKKKFLKQKGKACCCKKTG